MGKPPATATRRSWPRYSTRHGESVRPSRRPSTTRPPLSRPPERAIEVRVVPFGGDSGRPCRWPGTHHPQHPRSTCLMEDSHGLCRWTFQPAAAHGWPGRHRTVEYAVTRVETALHHAPAPVPRVRLYPQQSLGEAATERPQARVDVELNSVYVGAPCRRYEDPLSGG